MDNVVVHETEPEEKEASVMKSISKELFCQTCKHYYTDKTEDAVSSKSSNIMQLGYYTPNE